MFDGLGMNLASGMLAVSITRHIAEGTTPIARETVGIEFEGPVVTWHDIVMTCAFTTKDAIDHIGNLDDIKKLLVFLDLN